MFKHSPFCCLVALALAAACSSSDDTASNDGQIVYAADKLTVFSSQEADLIKVDPDRIIVPYVGYEKLLQKQAGDIVVSDRGTPNGRNPYGFLRKVVTVAQEGDKIVIMTAQGALTDVIKSGKVAATLTPKYDSTTIKAIGPNGEPIGRSRDGFEVGVGLDFDSDVSIEGSKEFSVPIAGKQLPIKTKAGLYGKVHTGFEPSIDIGATLDWFNITEFHAIARGDFSAWLDLKATAEVSFDKTWIPSKPGTPMDGTNWLSAMGDLYAAQKKYGALEQKKTLLSYSVPGPTFPVGPVPVVTDFNFDLELSCSLAVQGSMTLDFRTEVDAGFEGGIRFDKGQWSPVSGTHFNFTRQGPNLTGEADNSFDCYLKPKHQLRLYSAVGPYVYVQPYGGIGAKIKSECNSGKVGLPTCTTDLFGSLGVKGGVGAKIEIGILGVQWRQDIAEMPLFDLEFLPPSPPLWTATFECPFGYCFVACDYPSTKCTDDATGVLNCKADGTGYDPGETCASGTQCVGEIGKAKCGAVDAGTGGAGGFGGGGPAGSGGGGPAGFGGGSSCTPDWQCQAWSVCDCTGNKHTTCSDNNSCGTNDGKPPESQACDPCEVWASLPGDYLICGGSSFMQGGGCLDKLYLCSSGTTKSTTDCPSGCVANQPNNSDACDPCIPEGGEVLSGQDCCPGAGHVVSCPNGHKVCLVNAGMC
jgi:hypothetical protein